VPVLRTGLVPVSRLGRLSVRCLPAAGPMLPAGVSSGGGIPVLAFC